MYFQGLTTPQALICYCVTSLLSILIENVVLWHDFVAKCEKVEQKVEYNSIEIHTN